MCLDNWKAFYSSFEAAQKTKQKFLIQEYVYSASRQLKRLRSSRFFDTYPRFNAIALDFTDKFDYYLEDEKENKYIKYAAVLYFTKFFNDVPEHPQIEVKCRSKESSGAQVSFKSL